MAPGGAPMIGQGLGSGMMIQQGGQPEGSRPGMMGGMGQMTPMMRQMMSMMGHQGGMGAMGLPFEHVEGRIAFLRAELGITEAQLPAWNAFADALRVSAGAHRAAHERMGKGGMPSSWPDLLSGHLAILSARVDALKALEAAAKPLYAVLAEGQRKLADGLLSGPMGMM
jgi:hypothetical protein